MRKLAFILTALLISTVSHAQERVVWDKKPIEIILQPNVEKMLVLPTESARVKIPAAIRGSLDTLSNNGVIYWTASEEFSAKRVLIQDTQNQQMLVVNLSSSAEHGTGEAVSVLYKSPEQEAADENVQQQNAQLKTYGYEELTRTAAKHLYAPERLIQVPDGMFRINVKQVSDLHLIRGHIVEMTPVISFSNAGLYVTAVKLRNKQSTKVILDPRDIRGNWLAATFQHATLGPTGELTDTTALYLISKRPFWESF